MLAAEATVEHLGHNPQQAQYEQDAHKRRQMGDSLEYRHEDEASHAEIEHRLALSVGKVLNIGVLLANLGNVHRALQRERDDIGRNDH